MLSISALGGFNMAFDGRRVELRSRKSQALVTYLLLSPAPSETRERLCGLLWSEFSEEKARASLRQVLHGLRETFDRSGFQGLALDREIVRLDRSSIEFDVTAAFDELSRKSVPMILTSIEQPHEALLAGFEGLDPGFDVWLAIHRRLVRERFEHSLLILADDDGNQETAIRAATALMNIDPTNEVACRILMRARAARGELSAGLKIYRNLWDHLADEYDMEPSPETQALAIQLKSSPPAGILQGALPADVSDVRPEAAEERGDKFAQYAIVVAPFDSHGVSTEIGYLISGLRQELIAKLVRFREWAIIDGRHIQTDAMQSFDARWPNHVWLDALVFEFTGEIRISISVRRRNDANVIWSDSFNFGLDSWFKIERELLSRIAATLNIHVSTARLIASSGAPDVSLAVYDRWLRGQSIIMNWKPDRDLARGIYRTILAEAPYFSPAHSSLAQLENMEHLALPGTLRTTVREASGLDHARRAVRYDPFDSRAHLALGWASAMNGQFDQAYAAFTMALELNENDPWTINSAALGCAYCGDVDRAQATIENALTWGLKPTAFHAAYQGAVRFMAGNYRAALVAYEQAGDIIGDLAAWKAATLAHLGRSEEARETMLHFKAHARSRWSGAEEATEERLAAWLLHAFPIRARNVWENLRDGVIMAGLMVPPEDRIPRKP